FNAMDASPFRERDLDPDAEDLIVGWAREAPRGSTLALLVGLDRAPGLPDEPAALRDAVHEFFAHRAQVTRSRLRELLREGLVICGWVAMWRPLEILLYGWWPIRTEARLYDRLSAMPVRIAYKGTAESGAWRRDWPAAPPAQTTPQKLPPHASSLRGGDKKPSGANTVPERGPIASAIGSTAPERESHARSPKL